MTGETVADAMRSAAKVLLRSLDDEQRVLAALPFADDAARRWVEYRPARRPGACLALVSPPARKAAHRLLATALSERGYAQAVTVMALEEVLDRQEGWRNGRHSGDYWVSVFGDPAGGEPWSWRFEGHHLSVNMTLAGDEVSPAPVFLGAHPARVGELHFAWEGPLTPGTRHYYRVQGEDLLIEYDNTDDDGNHAHTVLRWPHGDFGDDILAGHYAQAHQSAS